MPRDDLFCPCGWFEPDVYWKPSHPRPCCPDCGGQTQIDYRGRRGEVSTRLASHGGTGDFQVFWWDSQSKWITSADQWRAEVKKMEAEGYSVGDMPARKSTPSVEQQKQDVARYGPEWYKAKGEEIEKDARRKAQRFHGET